MFNIGAGEIAVILIAALLLLGPEKLPELARGIGKFLREFRRQTDDVRTMVEREFYQMDQEIKTLNQDIQRDESAAKPALPSPESSVPILPEAEGSAPSLPAEIAGSVPSPAETITPADLLEAEGKVVPFMGSSSTDAEHLAQQRVDPAQNGMSEESVPGETPHPDEPVLTSHPEGHPEDSPPRGK